MLFDASAFAAALVLLSDVVMSLEWLLLLLLSCSGRLLLLLVLITVVEAFRLVSAFINCFCFFHKSFHCPETDLFEVFGSMAMA